MKVCGGLGLELWIASRAALGSLKAGVVGLHE
jgi:hypothetical protein